MILLVELENWEQHVVRQRNSESGCIPTGIEWLIRQSRKEGVDFTDFQERYDFGLQVNNFVSVPEAVMKDYKLIRLKRKEFPRECGREKVAFLQRLVAEGVPSLISILVEIFHVSPVVAATRDALLVVMDVNDKGDALLECFSLDELIRKHRDDPGGQDILWIDGP